ncbi:MAG TPA: nitroreductase family protein [Candidatus Nanoarchaeia archaeon]|nr:nitroreductase family protein [Candidatus Nanoarchaeia archaeon]
MKLTEAINKRTSIRKFKDKKVKFGDVLEAIDAALKTPLAGNISTLKFIIITDPDTKEKIAEYADQLWLADADTLVVVCSEMGQIERMYKERGHDYAKQQVGAAIQNFLLCITEIGLASCWVGAYLDHEIKNLLRIPGEIVVEAILPVGHPDEKPKPKKKVSLEHAIYWDKWKQNKKPTLTKDPATR